MLLLYNILCIKSIIRVVLEEEKKSIFHGYKLKSMTIPFNINLFIMKLYKYNANKLKVRERKRENIIIILGMPLQMVVNRLFIGVKEGRR